MNDFIQLQIRLGGKLFVRPEEISAVQECTIDFSVIRLRGQDACYTVQHSTRQVMDMITAYNQRKAAQ